MSALLKNLNEANTVTQMTRVVDGCLVLSAADKETQLHGFKQAIAALSRHEKMQIAKKLYVLQCRQDEAIRELQTELGKPELSNEIIKGALTHELVLSRQRLKAGTDLYATLIEQIAREGYQPASRRDREWVKRKARVESEIHDSFYVSYQARLNTLRQLDALIKSELIPLFKTKIASLEAKIELERRRTAQQRQERAVAPHRRLQTEAEIKLEILHLAYGNEVFETDTPAKSYSLNVLGLSGYIAREIDCLDMRPACRDQAGSPLIESCRKPITRDIQDESKNHVVYQFSQSIVQWLDKLQAVESETSGFCHLVKRCLSDLLKCVGLGDRVLSTHATLAKAIKQTTSIFERTIPVVERVSVEAEPVISQPVPEPVPALPDAPVRDEKLKPGDIEAIEPLRPGRLG